MEGELVMQAHTPIAGDSVMIRRVADHQGCTYHVFCNDVWVAGPIQSLREAYRIACELGVYIESIQS